jgi:hypothetical protein
VANLPAREDSEAATEIVTGLLKGNPALRKQMPPDSSPEGATFVSPGRKSGVEAGSWNKSHRDGTHDTELPRIRLLTASLLNFQNPNL